MRDSGCVVFDFEDDVGSFLECVASGKKLSGRDLFAEGDCDGSGFSVEGVPRIGDEVQNDLMNFVLIDSNYGEVGFRCDGKLNGAGNGGFDQLQRFANGGLGMAGCAVLRDAVGVAEHLEGEFAATARTFDDVGVAFGIGWLGREAAEFGVSDNSTEDIVDIVNDATAEHADISESVGVHDFVTVLVDFGSEIENFGAQSTNE